jgi:DNA-binding NtrC family response regulator
MRTVLIADDEKNIRNTLSTTLRLDGYRVLTAGNGKEALESLEKGGVDLVILDLQMPRLDGMETLAEMRRRGWQMPVMFLTAHGSIEKAVEAIRLGAFDFVEKPPHAEKILLTARNALRQANLEEENRELREAAEERYDMVGSTEPMKLLYDQIRRVAPTQARVLIVGENGTGKELIARALHRHSPRAPRPFVCVNCAAIPRDLFESELFGHERGAFTGATTRRRGKFVRAHGGTLFLDEVGEIPVEMQAKILRALESEVVEPVGSEREVEVDVRVISASNRDLEKEVEEGRFREDLFYRLKVVTLSAPPLRDRMEDIPALVEHFMREACSRNNLRPRRITPLAMECLATHSYPGNVRELKNLVERLVILAAGENIDGVDVEEALPSRRHDEHRIRTWGRPLRRIMTDLERDVLTRVLKRNKWKMSAAARELDLERSHLYKKVKALGIQRPENET